MHWLHTAALSLLATSAACGGSGATGKSMGTGESAGTGGAAASTKAASSSGTGGSSPACTAQAAHFQKLLESSKPSEAPGAVLAIVTPACGEWVGATGTSTPTEPIKGDDVMRVGSVTKTFVSARVLQLTEAGTLALDDDLAKWFPAFPNAAGISVRQLLGHTSGIFDYTTDATFEATVSSDPTKKWTPQELVDIAAAQRPYFAPGMGWHYSNTNYILLGMIVESVTADTIGKEIRAHVLTPNALDATSFDGEEPILGNLAHGWQGTVDVSTTIDPSYAWAAGAMVANMGDLAHYAGALYSGKLLKASTMKEMLTTVDTDQAGLHYGLGVFVGDASIAGDTIIGHPGDIPGYHTDMWYLPNEQISFATSVNADGADPNDIVAAVLMDLVK